MIEYRAVRAGEDLIEVGDLIHVSNDKSAFSQPKEVVYIAEPTVIDKSFDEWVILPTARFRLGYAPPGYGAIAGIVEMWHDGTGWALQGWRSGQQLHVVKPDNRQGVQLSMFAPSVYNLADYKFTFQAGIKYDWDDWGHLWSCKRCEKHFTTQDAYFQGSRPNCPNCGACWPMALFLMPGDYNFSAYSVRSKRGKEFCMPAGGGKRNDYWRHNWKPPYPGDQAVRNMIRQRLEARAGLLVA